MSDTPEEKRRKRLQLLIQKLQNNGETDYREIVGWSMLSWGCKRQTAETYLVDLEWASLVLIERDREGGVVRWIGPKGT